jgi:hypothetical protein
MTMEKNGKNLCFSTVKAFALKNQTCSLWLVLLMMAFAFTSVASDNSEMPYIF